MLGDSLAAMQARQARKIGIMKAPGGRRQDTALSLFFAWAPLASLVAARPAAAPGIVASPAVV